MDIFFGTLYKGFGKEKLELIWLLDSKNGSKAFSFSYYKFLLTKVLSVKLRETAVGSSIFR